ncbi:glycosyltransferase-like protein gnt14 [Gordionus sp. m RMFG-2023]|uniref:glycosyltransferase-like protein gnt14 n=1 Tax=Gordionus sp. m RMFG-2023 TaxID=3053472 RepID=UPI0031FC45A0
MIEIGRKLDSINIKSESDKFNKNNDNNRNNDKNLDIQSTSNRNEINSNYNRPNYYSRQNFDSRNRNYDDNNFSNVNDNRNRNFSNVRNNNYYNNNNYRNNQFNDSNYQNYNYRYNNSNRNFHNNNYLSYNNNYGRNHAWFNYNQRRQIQCDDQNHNNYRSYNNNSNNYEGNNRWHSNDNQGKQIEYDDRNRWKDFNQRKRIQYDNQNFCDSNNCNMNIEEVGENKVGTAKDNNENDYNVNNLAENTDKDDDSAFKTTLKVNNVTTTMQVDTGSKYTIIPHDMAKKIGIREIKKSRLRLTAYDGNLIKIIKEMSTPIMKMKKDCESKLTSEPINKIDLVGEELNRWIHEKIIEPVNDVRWASPITAVYKDDGSIRLCADFKDTINPALEDFRYPLPLPIDKNSIKFLTISTHKGYYQFTRLPFGLKTSSAIFQQIMDQIFGDMKDVIFYIDDLLITGNNDEAHFNNIKKVFERILSYGLVPNFAKTDPLYKIVNKEKWAWNLEHSKSFNNFKKLFSLPPALTYFTPELPIGIATDASKCGLGAELFHTEKDGKEKPIAFASRTLLKSELNCINIEREALAIMFAIKRFQEYLIDTIQLLLTINLLFTSLPRVLRIIVPCP